MFNPRRPYLQNIIRRHGAGAQTRQIRAYFDEDADTMYTHNDTSLSKFTKVTVPIKKTPLAAAVSSHMFSSKRSHTELSFLCHRRIAVAF